MIRMTTMIMMVLLGVVNRAALQWSIKVFKAIYQLLYLNSSKLVASVIVACRVQLA